MYQREDYTTKNESNDLLSLGVNKITASLEFFEGHIRGYTGDENATPVWSTWDLIKLLPDSIERNGYTFFLNFYRDFFEYYCPFIEDEEKAFLKFTMGSMKTNCIECIKWVKENNLKLKGERFNFFNQTLKN